MCSVSPPDPSAWLPAPKAAFPDPSVFRPVFSAVRSDPSVDLPSHSVHFAGQGSPEYTPPAEQSFHPVPQYFHYSFSVPETGSRT